MFYDVSSDTCWMYGGQSEYTLSYYYNQRTAVFVSLINNTISSGDAIYNGTHNYYYARPTFYLSSSVEYSSGSGTQSDPIILNVDNS